MAYFKFYSPKEATGMSDERIMAIYNYQYALAESTVARKKRELAISSSL
jgi:hypothetical protein